MPKMLKKILIVDDHDDLSTVLTREFTRDGYLLKTVESRDEAVEIIEEKNFDCIITDLDGEHLTAESNEPDDLTCLPEAVADARKNIKAFKICVSNYKDNQFTEEELK